MEQKTINVTRPFTLVLKRDGKVQRFPILPGVQDVDADVADHWYTQAFCEELPKALKPKEDKKP